MENYQSTNIVEQRIWYYLQDKEPHNTREDDCVVKLLSTLVTGVRLIEDCAGCGGVYQPKKIARAKFKLK